MVSQLTFSCVRNLSQVNQRTTLYIIELPLPSPQCTSTSPKIWISWKISNSETFIYFIFITHKLKYFKYFFFVFILIVMAYSSWKSKIQILNISEYFTRSIKKKRFLDFCKVCSFMPSILGPGSFCMSSCISTALRGGDQPVALLSCYGSPCCFGRGLQLICIVLSLIFLLTPHRFLVGFRSGKLAGQSNTVIPWSANQLWVVLALWAGAKSCWKWL